MKALISPNEPVIDPNTGIIIGQRIAEVSEIAFEVAPPLFWMDCANDVRADQWYYDPTTQQIDPTPQPLPLEEPEQAVVTGAQTL